MKKLAVIFEGSIYNRKGLVNAVLERTKRLNLCADFEVDVFCIMAYENSLIRKLRHTKKREKKLCEVVDGLKVNILWHDFSLIDYISSIRLHKEQFFLKRWVKHISKKFQGYDLILAHSYTAGLIGLKAKQKYNIPYCVTWHGSDIHTAPVKNGIIRKNTKSIIDSAISNLYVSKALLETAKNITDYRESWLVSYNGASDSFYQFSNDKKNELRKKYNITNDTKIVAFVGNLIDIKNVLILPDVFKKVQEKYKHKIKFWLIGDGKLRNILDQQFKECNINYKMWGNQSEDIIPSLMNCIDLLVLPSKNEGLPLVVVEALRCGANVVGSNVGGIAEVIGLENVFDLDECFVPNISNRIIEFLNGNITQVVSEDFSWNKTIAKELRICKSILSENN